jgi:hypothetical protein
MMVRPDQKFDKINIISNVKSQSIVPGGFVKLKHDSNNL